MEKESIKVCMNCGNDAEVETIEGFILCSSCESTYNNIINEPRESLTMSEFEKGFKYLD